MHRFHDDELVYNDFNESEPLLTIKAGQVWEHRLLQPRVRVAIERTTPKGCVYTTHIRQGSIWVMQGRATGDDVTLLWDEYIQVRH